MPICTKCGVLMHVGDELKHKCNPADIPEKGKPIRKGFKKNEIK